VQGSGISPYDLKYRLKIKQASKVILLARGALGEGVEELYDLDVIFSYNAITNAMEMDRWKKLILVDIVNAATINFFTPNKTSFFSNDSLSWVQSIPYASGQVVLETVFDNILAKVSYEPSLLCLLEQLVGLATPTGKRIKTEVATHSDDLAVKGQLSIALGVALSPTRANEGAGASTVSTMRVEDKEAYLDDIERELASIGLYSCHMYLRPITNLMHTAESKRRRGRPSVRLVSYGEVFDDLIDKGMLSVGLYRLSKFKDHPSLPDKHPYVLTNPSRDLLVDPSTDFVYILAQQQEGSLGGQPDTATHKSKAAPRKSTVPEKLLSSFVQSVAASPTQSVTTYRTKTLESMASMHDMGRQSLAHPPRPSVLPVREERVLSDESIPSPSPQAAGYFNPMALFKDRAAATLTPPEPMRTSWRSDESPMSPQGGVFAPDQLSHYFQAVDESPMSPEPTGRLANMAAVARAARASQLTAARASQLTVPHMHPRLASIQPLFDTFEIAGLADASILSPSLGEPRRLLAPPTQHQPSLDMGDVISSPLSRVEEGRLVNEIQSVPSVAPRAVSQRLREELRSLALR